MYYQPYFLISYIYFNREYFFSIYDFNDYTFYFVADEIVGTFFLNYITSMLELRL